MWWQIIMLTDYHVTPPVKPDKNSTRSVAIWPVFLGLYLVAGHWTLATTSFSSCLHPFSRTWHPWGLTCAVVWNGMCACLVIKQSWISKHKLFWCTSDTLRRRMQSSLRVLIIFYMFCFATALCLSTATSCSSCLQPCSRTWHPWGLTLYLYVMRMCAFLEIHQHKLPWYQAMMYAILLTCADEFLRLLFCQSLCSPTSHPRGLACMK